MGLRFFPLRYRWPFWVLLCVLSSPLCVNLLVYFVSFLHFFLFVNFGICCVFTHLLYIWTYWDEFLYSTLLYRLPFGYVLFVFSAHLYVSLLVFVVCFIHFLIGDSFGFFVCFILFLTGDPFIMCFVSSPLLYWWPFWDVLFFKKYIGDPFGICRVSSFLLYRWPFGCGVFFIWYFIGESFGLCCVFFFT